MTTALITALAAFAFVSLITPGPNNLMLMASGMNYGWYRSLPHMLGVGLGFPAMVLLVGLGLMQVFEAVPYSFVTLKVVSAIYLVYLAWKIATAAPLDESGNVQGSKPFTFLQAAAFQWVNPKAWAMALTAISVYTPITRPFSSILIVSLTFATIGILSTSAWTFLGQKLRLFLRSLTAQRTFNVLCALLLIASLMPMIWDMT